MKISPRGHNILSGLIVMTGVSAAIAGALDASPIALCVLASAAYGLAAFSHFTLLALHEDKPSLRLAVLAAGWPIVALWLVAWTSLPAPIPARARSEGDNP